MMYIYYIAIFFFLKSIIHLGGWVSFFVLIFLFVFELWNGVGYLC